MKKEKPIIQPPVRNYKIVCDNTEITYRSRLDILGLRSVIHKMISASIAGPELENCKITFTENN